MKGQVLTIEADSVAKAWEKAIAMAPSDLSVRKDNILSPEKKAKERAFADTEEEAYKKAMAYVHPDAQIIEKKIVFSATNKSILTKAPDEATARKLVAKKIDGSASIKSITLTKQGKSFLGIWIKLNHYTFEVYQPYVVEVIYWGGAKINLVFGGDNCAKCSRTWDDLENHFAELSTRGAFLYGDGVPLLLYCEKCRQSFCSSCQINLGKDSGCPNCNNALHAWDNELHV